MWTCEVRGIELKKTAMIQGWILMLLVAIFCLIMMFQGHVSCWNFTFTGPTDKIFLFYPFSI